MSLDAHPTYIERDNEFTKGLVKTFFEERSIQLEPSASDTQEQNGGAERLGGVVMTKARAMRGHLPHQLWSDIVSAAVYFLN
jgi:hypothetical protein